MSDDRTYAAEVFRRTDGVFDWRLIAGNGETVCSSDQGYTEPNDAWEGFGRVVSAVQLADDDAIALGTLVSVTAAIRARADGEPAMMGQVEIREEVAEA